MEKETVNQEILKDILHEYDFAGTIIESKQYIGNIVDGWVKFVIGVVLSDEHHLIIKIFREDGGTDKERLKIENQSAFSELLRANGIKTPKRYKSGEKYTTERMYKDLNCIVTVEDWCGEEITEITTDIAYQIGVLMARMHNIAVESEFKIGCGTLFGAAYENDVDAYESFCKICENQNLNQGVVSEIKKHREVKLANLRSMWESLPKAATQGDISINNLAWENNELTMFDYNNAGDEVLVSDLVLEGLLTAYEMELADGTPPEYRKQLFPSLLRGYLSTRKLSDAECAAAWEIYTLYNGLWFTKVLYNENSLDKLVSAEKYDEANKLLCQMLTDITESDDGRFGENQK